MGEVMSNARFSVLQSRAVMDKRISNAEFRTLAALGTFGDKDGWCFPRLKTIGDMLGKSRQAVSQDIARLAAMGYIEIHHQKRDDGSNGSNKYRILFDTPIDASQPCQPDINTPKLDLNTRQPQDLTPVNLRALQVLSSEVDALTPHDNVPINAPIEVKNNGAKAHMPKKRDELLNNPAIQAYRTIANYQIPTALRQEVADTVDNIELWKLIVYDWIGYGWNKQNIKGMLESYRSGGIAKKSSNNAMPQRTRKLTDADGNVIEVTL